MFRSRRLQSASFIFLQTWHADMPTVAYKGTHMLALLAIFAVLAALFTELGLLTLRAHLEAEGPSAIRLFSRR